MAVVKASDWARQVLPHGPLRPLVDGVWQVQGSLPKGAMTRNMVVFRLADGTLWLHSVVAVDEATLKQIESLGRPSLMVVPNPIHRRDAAVYKQRFPFLKVVCPKAARKQVEKVVVVDGVVEDVFPTQGVDFLRPDGLKDFELTYVLSAPSGKVLVFADALMNLPHFPGFEGALLRFVGSTGFFGITRVGRLLLLRNRRSFADWLKQISALPGLCAISMAHGEPILHNCAERLLQARSRLVVD